MKRVWYIFENNHHKGPYSVDDLKGFFQEGRINEESLIWREGISEWMALNQITEIAPEIIPDFSADSEVDGPPPLPPLDDLKNGGVITTDAEPPLSNVAKELNTQETPDIPEQENIATEVVDLKELGLAGEPAANVQTQQDIQQPGEIDQLAETQVLDISGLEPVPESAEQDEEDKRTPTDLQQIDPLTRGDYYFRYVGKLQWAYIAVVVIVVLVPLISLILYGHTSYKKYAVQVKPDDFVRLEKSFEGDNKAGAFELAYMPTPEKSKLHKKRGSSIKRLLMSANNPDAFVYLTLESVDKRVLDDAKIVISSESFLQNGWAKFTRFTFNRGDTFAPGYYMAKVRFFKGNMSALPGVISTNSSNPLTEFNKVVFLSEQPEKLFEKSLLDYFGRIKNRKTEQLNNLMQKYLTLASLLDRLLIMYREHLGKINFGTSIKHFEKAYTRSQLSRIFQDMVQTSEKSRKAYVAKRDLDKSTQKEYEQFIGFGMDFGSLVSDMVSKTRKYKRLSKNRKVNLINTMTDRAIDLKQKAQAEIESIEKIINGE